MDPQDVTHVQNAIHNPDDPRHFMTVTPAGEDRSASIGGVEVARSSNAVAVKEVGGQIYDPMIYFPRDDVRMDLLTLSDRTTFCPIKGDTEYFDFQGEQGVVTHAAWSYIKMALGDELKHLIAFDPAQTTVL